MCIRDRVYTALAQHFERDDIALPGFAQLFAARASAQDSSANDKSSSYTELATRLTAREVDTMLLNKVPTTVGVPPASTSADNESNPLPVNALPPREAFAKMDVDASKKAHSTEEIKIRIAESATEKHSKLGERLKSIVYGGLDGIITTFAVVAGATGGHLDTSVILILGVSNMFADGVSMGMGDAISTKAENEMTMKERDREAWEMENYPEGEIEEMVELYTQRGLEPDKARLVVENMASNKDFLIDQMVTDELGLELPDEDDNPWKDGLVTFTSFVFFGMFPLLAYICLNSTDLTQDALFVMSCCLTGVMLFILGVVKSQFTQQMWYLAGTEILCLGGFTAAVSYGIGALVAEIV
eukprot:TRINITY_DN9468_c0_g1_i1.p1 TRINITY_DN9468_c0_g1~~TRINITY_DN9468_c0_g1_i1.p1  ORF type:complete len:357 (+),score=101.54 TRINITY_DN9468_c0_g1_i1:107-1177(+)